MKHGVFVFAVALDALSGVSGCSFIFVKAPSTTPQQAQRPDCTPSYAAPVVDTVLVGTAVSLWPGAPRKAVPGCEDHMTLPISRQMLLSGPE